MCDMILSGYCNMIFQSLIDASRCENVPTVAAIWARDRRNRLFAPGGEEGTRADKERIRPFALQTCEYVIDFAAEACFEAEFDRGLRRA
jgi:hypothetical protein